MSTKNLSLSFCVIISLLFLTSCTESSNTGSAATLSDTAYTSTSTLPTVSTNTKTISYTTDHGKERVTVAFLIGTDTVGNITAVNANASFADHESRQYINRFNSAAKSQIVGKKVSSLSLSAVGGASDTTDAFVQAVKGL